MRRFTVSGRGALRVVTSYQLRDKHGSRSCRRHGMEYGEVRGVQSTLEEVPGKGQKNFFNFFYLELVC